MPPSPPIAPDRRKRALILAGRIAAAVALTFIFLTSVAIISSGFKMAGKGAVDGLLETAKNPFVGLFCGLLVTSVLQSSSATTSMLVGLVSSGVLDVRLAIPMVMGANIGTTVTNTIVAMGHLTRPQEFRRAVACSTMHDFFNMLTVLVMLPIEMTTHILERCALALSDVFSGVTGVKSHKSPLKYTVDWCAHHVQDLCAKLPGYWAPTMMAIIGIVVLFVSLYFLTRVLKNLMMGRLEATMGAYLDKRGPIGILIGAGVTALVQSSSVTTSFMVPIVAAGILKHRQVYPMVLGANLGTTITALLASLAGSAAGMELAFTHLLFNLSGILLFYPIPQMRWPIWIAKRFGDYAARHRVAAVCYVAAAFYGIPLLLMVLGRKVF